MARTRPLVAGAAVAVIAVSVLIAVLRNGGTWQRHPEEHTSPPPSAGTPSLYPPAESGNSGSGARLGKARAQATNRTPESVSAKSGKEVWTPPPRTKVLMADGTLVPVRHGRPKLGDPDVLAEVYDGAEPRLVKHVYRVLRSGSNEYGEYVLKEKYPEWVYDRIRELYPGKLGEVLARLAKLYSEAPPEEKQPPWFDITEDGGYLYVMHWGWSGKPREISPVAETKYGTVWYSGSEESFGTPGNLADWLAHRLAAGDTPPLPKVPPKGYQSWQDWVRDSCSPELLRQFGLEEEKS